MNSKNTPKTTRLLHLDYLRAVMMFLGVVVHASHSDLASGSFSVVRDISASFRMECFFLISGYFSYMLVERRGTSAFFNKRLVSLGIPALFCVICLVPITNKLMTTYFTNGGLGNEYLTSWMAHSWFLFTLLVFTALLVIFAKAFMWFFSIKLNRITFVMSYTVIFFGMILSSMLSIKIVNKFGDGLAFSEYWVYIANTCFKYLPFFVFGLAMYAKKEIYNFVHDNTIIWLVLACIAAFIRIQIGGSEITSTLQHLKIMGADYTLAFLISAFLLSATHYFRDKNYRVLRIMSDSSYTVYIIHYIIIATVLVTLQPLNLALPVLFLTAFLTSSLLGVAFHLYVVKKFSLAGYLFSGKAYRDSRA